MQAAAAGADRGAPALRIDRLLFFLRLAKSRSLAQKIVERGHMRLNGKRVTSAHQPVRVGDILTLPDSATTRLLRIAALPARRGPASEAAACYEELEPGR